MEKGEFIPLLWFFLSFGLMFGATNFIPPPLGTYIGGASIFIMIPGLIIQENYLRWRLSSEHHLNATIFPENLNFHLFFTPPTANDSLDVGDGVFYTRLTLTRMFLYRNRKYKWVFIMHPKIWIHTVAPRKGYAYFAGMFIEHSITDNVVLYKRLEVDGDQYSPCPIFELKHSAAVYDEWQKRMEKEIEVRSYKPKR